jgi:CHASE2 domain-containing sensor protein
MSKQIVFSFLNGNLEKGFPFFTAILSEDKNTPILKFSGSLPPESKIPYYHERWCLLYEALRYHCGWSSRLEIDTGCVNTFSEKEFSEICNDLKNRLNNWLSSDSFRNIDKEIRAKLNHEDEIRVIIETDNLLLRRLPWHLWDFFQQFPKAEIALCAPDYQRPQLVSKTSTSAVKILAILGDSSGINIKQDEILLKNSFRGAKVKFLPSPSPQELGDQLWEQGWDILFFAGHSKSQPDGETGYIYINENDKLPISQLRNVLQRAINRGLKLAIFNSCDGLGLAQELAGLNIPQTIIMREPVPDKVAHEFLKYLLKAFDSGKSLYSAVREARDRLQLMEMEFPCATWLPTIFQNPLVVPPIWRNPLSSWHRLQALLCTSVLVTGLVMGVRSHGLLQKSEIPVYDQMMRLQGDEGKDSRLMVVTIDDDDILYQIKQGWKLRFSLSDEALALLLQKLDKYDPSAIGLHVPRDGGVDPAQADLKARLDKDHRLYATCFVPVDNKPGIYPPPGVPKERQGFTNIVRDSDGIVRRHLLSQGPFPDSPCTTPRSFSTMLAFRYLYNKGIKVDYKNGNWLFGNIVLKGLQGGDGGYTKDQIKASQIMLKYRTDNGSPIEIAEKVTLRQVLTNTDEQISEGLKHRIILIGVTTPSSGDRYPTPYSADRVPYREIPGVWLHTQMISQLLSAVLDNRRLLTVLPQQCEILLVLGSSLIGGMLVLRWQGKLHLTIAGGIAISALYWLCYGCLLLGYWVSFVPSVLAIIIIGGSVLIYFQVILPKTRY